ncbi:NIF family HAD-type phosphatase [Thiofilum flexile]|uniref:NIF family HAD-type phosphatase n=1 Tax=Thiofilum flexile TaxID=125627 RepID=UPI0003826C28|nr:NIF family HAD-type phosphatase [Thiofilum flexile]
MKPQRIAFDLDETLGTPIIHNNSIIGFNLRTGCHELLTELAQDHDLILWTVSTRSYVEKVLAYGLTGYFKEIYSWDELACEWKDIRRIHVDYLIDDSPHHQDEAQKYGLESHYIVVPAYGSPEDCQDALLWVKQIWVALKGEAI